MDFCRSYPLSQRRQRALRLLDLVDMADQANKLPSALSGGQQQRVAIARALANDPQLVIADEPTGNLDSKTAENVFNLFQSLTAEGKTVVMVTHDSSLARRVSRTVLITDGQVVNEYVARALPLFPPEAVLEAGHKVQPLTFLPGATILNAGETTQKLYMIVEGAAEVALKREGGTDVVTAQMGPGQYFGEISLSSRTVASMRAAPDQPVQVLAMDSETFQNLIASSPDFQSTLQTMRHQEAASERQAA
jgi:energy-coupling factor transporter ATP-binding protein EcfA2